MFVLRVVRKDWLSNDWSIDNLLMPWCAREKRNFESITKNDEHARTVVVEKIRLKNERGSDDYPEKWIVRRTAARCDRASRYSLRFFLSPLSFCMIYLLLVAGFSGLSGLRGVSCNVSRYYDRNIYTCIWFFSRVPRSLRRTGRDLVHFWETNLAASYAQPSSRRIESFFLQIFPTIFLSSPFFLFLFFYTNFCTFHSVFFPRFSYELLLSLRIGTLIIFMWPRISRGGEKNSCAMCEPRTWTIRRHGEGERGQRVCGVLANCLLCSPTLWRSRVDFWLLRYTFPLY